VNGRRIVKAAAMTVAGGVGLAACPSAVQAHLVTTGLGPIYDGLLHFALTPEDLVPVLALSVLAGLCGAAQARWVLFVLPAAWLAGGLVGLEARGSVSPVLSSISWVVLGGLVAAGVRLPPAATTGLAAMLGLLHGYLNGAAMAQPGLGALGLVGIGAAVFTFVTLTAASVVPLRAAWARMVARVAGSWIAATGLLLLGWSLRGA
jgi:urease accessory protein